MTSSIIVPSLVFLVLQFFIFHPLALTVEMSGYLQSLEKSKHLSNLKVMTLFPKKIFLEGDSLEIVSHCSTDNQPSRVWCFDNLSHVLDAIKQSEC